MIKSEFNRIEKVMDWYAKIAGECIFISWSALLTTFTLLLFANLPQTDLLVPIAKTAINNAPALYGIVQFITFIGFATIVLSILAGYNALLRYLWLEFQKWENKS